MLVQQTHFHWYTTPEELRDIANKMEQVWVKVRPGDDADVITVWGESMCLKILFDQDRMDYSKRYKRG